MCHVYPCESCTLLKNLYIAMTNKIYLSQSEIDEMIDSLIHQIKRGGKKYSKVVGIKNGGIHVSEKIAASLNLPHESVRISFYEGDFYEDYKSFNWCTNLLLVDDLIDRGRTCKHFYNTFGKVDTAVLLWRKESGIIPTYYARVKPQEWVVFTWEI